MDTHPGVLCQLPPHLRSLFPVTLSARAGLPTQVAIHMQALEVKAVSHKAIIDSYNQVQHEAQAQRQLNHVSLLVQATTTPFVNRSAVSAQCRDPHPIAVVRRHLTAAFMYLEDILEPCNML